jgi:hypothetical protein
LRIRSDLLAGGVFLLAFVFSLGIYLLAGERFVRRTLFFPGPDSHLLAGEERLLPLRRDREANILLLVEEIVLGPARPDHRRVLPRRTQVISLLLRHGTVYLNFSREALFPEEEVQSSVQERLQAVANTIRFNFPAVRRLQIAIEGQEPRFASSPEENFLYQPSMFR